MPLAHAEKYLFGVDPWLILDRWLGLLARPTDWLYGLWLPTQALVLFLVVLQRGSTAKARILISYVLAWFLLGVVGATLLSSAGPLFYDRLFGSMEFARLRETLQARGAWVALGESDRMWASLARGQPTIVAGISAVPSIHVAISFWMYLATRLMVPRASRYALAYAILIWIGSVQLGWHYVSDGLAGVLGMLVVWKLSCHLEYKLRLCFATVPRSFDDPRIRLDLDACWRRWPKQSAQLAASGRSAVGSIPSQSGQLVEDGRTLTRPLHPSLCRS